MFVSEGRGFRRRYRYGGTGLFDIFTSLASTAGKAASSAASAAANAASKVASSAVGKVAATTVTDVGKQLGKAALEAGKTAAVTAGKKAIENKINSMFNGDVVEPELPYVPPAQRPPCVVDGQLPLLPHRSLSSIIDGSGNKNKSIAIQELVKMIGRNPSGSGLMKT